MCSLTQRNSCSSIFLLDRNQFWLRPVKKKRILRLSNNSSYRSFTVRTSNSFVSQSSPTSLFWLSKTTLVTLNKDLEAILFESSISSRRQKYLLFLAYYSRSYWVVSQKIPILPLSINFRNRRERLVLLVSRNRN